ncbi:MAG TPA: hypothetical protein PLV39_13450 [Fimbriimonadaceae bacterium]|jgi:hypothetical protein|nr:hypothetical protein [Fimbriimonadaceae bacterium]
MPKPASSQLSGSEYFAFVPADRAFPRTIDDAEREFGVDIYDRMRHDPFIDAPLRYAENLVLEDGVTVTNCVPEPVAGGGPEAAALYDRGCEVAEFVAECFDELDEPIEMTVEGLLRALSHGHQLAETTYRLNRGGRYDGLFMLDSVRLIPRRNYVLVADQFNRWKGVIGYKPGLNAALYSGMLADPEALPGYLGKEKLVLLAFRRPNGVLVGESLIRSAYDAWKRCQIVKPVELAALAQFGGESVVITGVPASQDLGMRLRTMPDGTSQQVDFATWAAATVSAAFKSGGVAVLPGEMKMLTVGGQGNDAFERFMQRANREKMVSILYTARTLMESERSSQADAGKAENVSDLFRRYLREKVGSVLRRQLVRRLVALNWGEEIARILTPNVLGGSVSVPDMGMAAQAFATLRGSGGITDPMVPGVMRKWFSVEYVAEPDREPESSDEA